MSLRRLWRVPLLAVVLALLLAGCGQAATRSATPALWEVTGPAGERGWVFGTVHALPPDLRWQTPTLTSALGKADRLVLELDGRTGDAEATRRLLARLGTLPAPQPLGTRVPPDLRDELAALTDGSAAQAAKLDRLEDWAAALALAQLAASEGGLDPAAGAEQRLLAQAAGRPVEGLETPAGQLALFDRLDRQAQAALLAAVVTESAHEEPGRLIDAWSRGDMAALAAETHHGLLADPELRRVLLTQRNHAWAVRLNAMLKRGARPFVAVGAAHVAGPEGLPALLATRGWTVRRVQ